MQKWQNSNDSALKKIIVVIIERLDLISHLETIAMIVRKKLKYIEKIEGNIKIVFSEYNVFGRNFGGLQYDIEALDFYLHLTCIDAIQGQLEYKNPFDE